MLLLLPWLSAGTTGFANTPEGYKAFHFNTDGSNTIATGDSGGYKDLGSRNT